MQFQDDTNEELTKRPQGRSETTANARGIVQAVASDPWNDLLRTQGIQLVDLKHLRLREMYAPLDELDLEQALHLMQEQPIKGANEG